MINEVSKPLSNHIPVEKICEKLKKKDSQICELKYGEYNYMLARSEQKPWSAKSWASEEFCSCSVNLWEAYKQDIGALLMYPLR